MNISLTFRYLIFFVLFFACNASALEMYASSGMMGCYEKRAWNNPSSVHACLYENYGENLYGGVHDCSVVLYDTDLGYNRYASNCYNNKGYYETYVIYERARCPSGERFNSSTIACEPQCDYGTNADGTCMDACQFKQSIGGSVKLHWHPAVYGELVTGACYGDFGATRCEMTKNESTIICTGVPDGQYTPDSQCSLNFAYTGKQCDGGTLFWGVNGPDEPIFPPDQAEDPTHDPDDPTGDIEDPSVLPDDSTNTFDPNDVDPEPDVEDPETDESTDTAVVSAIQGLNADINKGIHDLNVDLNESQTQIANAVIEVKGSLVDNTQAIQEQQINDNKIYENTKALIQQANGDITTAVNNNTNATIGVRTDLQSLGDSLSGLDNSLDSIEGLLTGSEFGTPTGTAITGEIFTFEDLMDLQDTIQAKTESIETYVDDIKGLVSIGTNFNNGTLSDKSFSIKGATVESGLQRFDSVSGYVRPVVLFICALIALWVLFGNRSK
ncbi:hypothetical protein [Vibrio parahaemolyticus]|uniref:hypothetical protein n=1 Tax=Vibrio parahaemolyticus TaxID=670 RepID=UPI00235DE96F|nr:hypothetical protein [Vibrio parahaemolyticus]